MKEGYKGIFIQSKKEGKEKYDSGVTISDPDEAHFFCRGRDFRLSCQLIVIQEVLGSFRRGIGMTSQEMANKIGKYHKVIEDIEDGTKDVNLQDLQYMANALGVDIEIVIKPKKK